jgi:transcriptional regulator GlxA family with amidase domain
MSEFELTSSPQRHIVVRVYPDVTAMDVCTPMEAFAMANFLANRGLRSFA